MSAGRGGSITDKTRRKSIVLDRLGATLDFGPIDMEPSLKDPRLVSDRHTPLPPRGGRSCLKGLLHLSSPFVFGATRDAIPAKLMAKSTTTKRSVNISQDKH